MKYSSKLKKWKCGLRPLCIPKKEKKKEVEMYYTKLYFHILFLKKISFASEE
jgi:hypothetical protein